MSLRTHLAVVRGLGSAKSGTGHFWMQRLTAIALVPLTLWFVGAVLALAGASHADAARWLASPWNATLTLAFIVASFWHGQLGLQVVIEDYVHAELLKLACLVALHLATFLLALLAILAVLRVFVGT